MSFSLLRITTILSFSIFTLLPLSSHAQFSPPSGQPSGIEVGGGVPGNCRWSFSCADDASSGFATLSCLVDNYWVEWDRQIINCGGERRLPHHTEDGYSEIGLGSELTCDVNRGSLGITIGGDFLQTYCNSSSGCSIPLNSPDGRLSCAPSDVTQGWFVCSAIISVDGIELSFGFHLQGAGGTYTYTNELLCRFPRFPESIPLPRIIIDSPRDPLNPTVSDPQYLGHIGVGIIW
jgi:hypothetical protein